MKIEKNDDGDVKEKKLPTKTKVALVSAVQKIKVRSFSSYMLDGLAIWAINFVILEILISGGRNENNLYVAIVSIGIVFFSSLFINLKKPVANLVAAVYRGLFTALTYALLDFLVVNLLLEKNSYAIYHFWGYLATYGTVLVTPVLIRIFVSLIASRKNKGLAQRSYSESTV